MEQQDIITGIVPFILGQKWAFTARFSRYIVELLEYTDKIDTEILIKTIRYMQQRHDILRTCIVKGPNGWQQVIPYLDESTPLTRIFLSVRQKQEIASIIKKTTESFFRELDGYDGPLIRFAYFDSEDNKTNLLLIVVHHLIYDRFSHNIFLDEFSKIYQSIQSDKDIRLSSKPTSFKQFAEEIMRYTHDHFTCEFEKYWSLLPWEKAKPFPADFSEEYIRSTEETRRDISVTWTPEETSKLLGAMSSAQLPTADVLLSALALTIAQWTGEPFVHIVLMDLGRITFSTLLNLNLTKTIGFLAVNRRLFLDIRNILSPKDTLQIIQKETNKIPHKGVALDVLHRCSNNKHIIEFIDQHACSPAVLFNFLGRQTEEKGISRTLSWRPSREYRNINLQKWESPQPPNYESIAGNLQNRKYRALHWEGIIVNDQLCFTVWFDSNMYRRDTVEHICQDFKNNLSDITFAESS